MLAEKRSKEAEIKFLIGQTIADLWRTDLDTILAQWDEFERVQTELESTRPGKSGPSKKIPLKKAKALKKDDSDISMEDDEFAPKKKKPIKAKSASSVVKKESPKASKISSSAPALDKPKPKPKPATKAAGQSKGIGSYFKAIHLSPGAGLSESLSAMDVDSRKKIPEGESMQVSDDDEIVRTKVSQPKRSPRATKKKAIIISSESEITESEAEFDEEESDFDE